MRFGKQSMRLYAVTDRAWVGRQSLYEQVEAAIRGGVSCVQLREKELGEEAILAEALAISALCRRYGIPFFINDHVEIAIRCGADGVHIGQEDMPLCEVRKRVGREMKIGVSAHSVEEALEAEKKGADCLGVGAMFPSSTKKKIKLLSLERLREICAAVKIPVVAIGGITKENIGQLFGSGVDGVALASGIFGAGNIERECRLLRKLSEEMAGTCGKGEKG